MMWEFKFYSRGGQGAVTAAKILVNAAILEGKFAQAIPSTVPTALSTLIPV